MNSTSKPFISPLLQLLLVAIFTLHYGHAQETVEPDPPTEEQPKTSVQIVNAMSVPSVSFKVDGQVFYPDFPQGLYTADAPIPKLKPLYTIQDKATHREHSEKVSYEADSYQSLILTGDFELVPVESESGSTNSREKEEEKTDLVPNVTFTVLSHKMKRGQRPIRYRFFNGMLNDRVAVNDGKKARWIEPSKSTAFFEQPKVKTFSVKFKNKTVDLLIRQEGTERNCTVIFYEKDGEPAFVRAFENTDKTLLRDSAGE